MYSMIRNLLFTLVLCHWIFPALAQEDTRGTIFGRITDTTGGVLVGVTVHATNPQTGVVLQSRSNDAGNYSVPFVPPGVYDVSLQYTGFKSLDRKGIEVHVAAKVQLDLEMAVGDATEKIEVVASAPLLETGSVSLGQVVDTKRMEKTIPIILQWDESFDIGSDTITGVNDQDYLPPFPLTAKFNKLTIKIDRPQLSPEDIKTLEEAMKKAALGIQ